MSYEKGTFPPAKHFVSILFHEQETLDAIRGAVVEKLGSIDMESDPFPFDMTDYYRPEMGEQLFRVFLVLAELAPASQMIQIKQVCLALEEQHREAGNRTANLDPGYVDLYKLVLASEKYRGHKIYLDKGICADLTLLLGKNTVTTFEWTFPDFKEPRYVPFILQMRNRYREQLRSRA